MATTTTTLPDGSVQTTNTDDATGKILWTSIAPPPGSLAAANIANTAAIQANIQTHIAQLEAWLTANPNGAVLTAAQAKFLAQTLVGVGRLLLGLTSTVGGAT